jgi:hypothetical protein
MVLEDEDEDEEEDAPSAPSAAPIATDSWAITP